MTERHLIIVGGGLAGLAAGCYARKNGYRTTIVEHNLALGGVCNAWTRGAYTVDGCIHWLTGGPFERLYEEVGILPAVGLNTLDTWAVYRDASDGLEVPFTRDLDAFVARLCEIAPEDARELERLRRAASKFATIAPPMSPSELGGAAEAARSFWSVRSALPDLVHYRQSLGAWASDKLTNPRLRRLFTRTLPENIPAVFLLMVLGYLERGWLSRPAGGTAAFRDAFVESYRTRGGDSLLHTTVDEIIVRNGRAAGVRLDDGTLLEGDAVFSTSSAPETVLRLLGGAYDAERTRERMRNWKLIGPIVLVSFGVARAYARAPGLLLVDHVPPFTIGDQVNDRLYVRTGNDDPSFAPSGHTVVQTMLETNYDWWARRGAGYEAAKEDVADRALAALEPHFPGIRDAVRMTDVATPLTYWRSARSWRGAYEGWMPSDASFFGHPKKRLAGLDGFYMAGQWVEPGGGIPTAVMSGRQAVELLCHDDGRAFHG